MVSGLAICLVLGFAAFMMRSQDETVEPNVAVSATEQTVQPASQAAAAPAQAASQSPAQSQTQNQAQNQADRQNAGQSAPAAAGPAARPKAAAIQPISKGPRVIMPETVSEIDGEGVAAGAGSEQVSIPLESRPQFANFAAALEGPDTEAAGQSAPYFGGLGIGGLGIGGPAQSLIDSAPQLSNPAGQAAAANAGSALQLPPATVGPLSMRIAAAKGDPSAEFEVATRLAEGKGTDQDFKEAHRWYQRSAAQGFAQALYRLATLHERGLGTKADVSRAKVMYQRAAELGNVKSMHNLAVLAAGRGGGSPDYTTAATWFTQAANHGLADSQFNLAVLTESGLGVPKDTVQAAMWFILAAQGGDKEAVRRRDTMKGKMERSDWSAAENLARSWQPIAPEKLANDARFAGELWKSRQASAEPTQQ